MVNRQPPIIAVLGRYYPEKGYIKTVTNKKYLLVSDYNTKPLHTYWYRLQVVGNKYAVIGRLTKTD